jgi:hypothetical protein
VIGGARSLAQTVVVSDTLPTGVLGANGQGKVITLSGSTYTYTGLGILFTTGGGNTWDLNSLTLAMSAGIQNNGNLTQYNGGVTASLYEVSGSGPTAANSLTFVAALSSQSLSLRAKGASTTITLTGLNNLSASSEYLIGLTFSGTINAAGYVMANSYTGTNQPTGSSGWVVPTTYSFLENGGFESSTTAASSAYASAGAAFTLDATAMSAVPEPSTYATIAGCGALGFAVYRRRRQRVGS